MEVLIDIAFRDENGKDVRVEVTSISGYSGGFYVYFNRYFQGKIVLYTNGWTPFVTLDLLNKDDLDAIMDIVNERYPVK